ncbi:MAG: hypothetical protein KAI02_01570 [Gammaproteobacteria bacterium]|nr:hypothetical protein [Gammaproteobacteria bacterium]
MINSLKAVSLGIITILVLGLCNQLMLIMGLVGYGSLVKSYPELQAWSHIFTYTLGGFGFCIVMFFGGFVTAMASIKYSYTKTIIASILGISASLYLSLKDEIFTPIALIFLISGILSATLGCRVWLNYQKNKQ